MRQLAFAAALIAALLTSSSPAAASGGWDWPVHGQVVTPYRNGDDPYAAGQHRGVDIAAPVGTAVVAAEGGTIEYAGVAGSSGVTVAERTADGRYTLSYLHLSSLSVRRGDAVAAGQPVGAVGISGTRSSQVPHLHFGVRVAGERHGYVDPMTLLAPPPADEPAPRPVAVPVAAPVPARPIGEAVPALAAVPAPLPVPAPGPAPVLPPAAASAHGVVHAAPALHLAQPSAASAAHGSSVRGAAHPAPSAAAPPQVPTGPRRRSITHTSGAHGRPVTHAAAHGPSAAAAHPPTTGAASSAAAAHGRPGVDAGWLAACLGMVAAAALLAGPGAGRRPRMPARAVFGQLLRAGSRQ